MNHFLSAITKHQWLIKKYDTRHAFYQGRSNKHRDNQVWHQTKAMTCIFMKFLERTWIVYITPNALPQDMGVR